MAYKDKDKQREANRERQRRYKAKHKGVTSEGVTLEALPEDIHPGLPACVPKPKRGRDIKCFADLPPDVQQTIHRLCMQSTGPNEAEFRRRTAIAISYQHSHANRYYPEDAVLDYVVIGKPGDEDYDGICTEDWRQERG